MHKTVIMSRNQTIQIHEMLLFCVSFFNVMCYKCDLKDGSVFVCVFVLLTFCFKILESKEKTIR